MEDELESMSCQLNFPLSVRNDVDTAGSVNMKVSHHILGITRLCYNQVILNSHFIDDYASMATEF